MKLHLDTKLLQLRGDVRADIPRDMIKNVVLADNGVRVLTYGPELLIELADAHAVRWQKALLKKPPTLAEKLGVSARNPVFVLISLQDDLLMSALDGATVEHAKEAGLLLAVVIAQADLHAASDFAIAHAKKHIWLVNRKGKAAMVGDTMIRTHMRGLGFIDSKTSAVSDQLSATRYRLRTK